MILVMGIQGSGKSFFCKERFHHTHLRFNLDLVKTRKREHVLIQTCFALQQQIVIDNTNVTRRQRAEYIATARTSGFRVIGYFLDTPLALALKRNENRSGRQRVPKVGLLGTFKKLEIPELKEGFHELYRVVLGVHQEFKIVPISQNDGREP